ncbi:uncharacterized protein LOC115438796 [Sphaeramia orbicularis]|uniref:Uncharacterized LOC115438796 n=1 Tax=Sphaeramia orbicularis TaxID=375764 RepID=A0A673AD17_9TELE|nr:uncharacterized protein LOC115438796 [Sphaeramia orbicularis]
MAETAVSVEAQGGASHSPLVSVTFQRNEQRKNKYLEAEPKALGITQIGLSVFQASCAGVFLAKGLSRYDIDIVFFISSLLIAIAGSVAVAAKNLHLPTLKACLGMEVLASVAAVFNLVYNIIKMSDFPHYCYHYYYDNHTQNYGEYCRKIEAAHSHFFAEGVLIQVALFAISVTLVAYTCKVVNCCSPAPKVPVITVQAPPAQQ